jgi:hypothetical protein
MEEINESHRIEEGLWFARRQRQTLSVGFSRASNVSLIFLVLCTLANFVIFLPAL